MDITLIDFAIGAWGVGALTLTAWIYSASNKEQDSEVLIPSPKRDEPVKTKYYCPEAYRELPACPDDETLAVWADETFRAAHEED